jgi:CRP-like cAMP-binding protein
VPALRILGREALRILAIGAETRYIHEGISLFGEGEDADSAYVVQEGSFDLVSEKNALPPSVAGPAS